MASALAGRFRLPAWVALVAFLGIGAFFLWTEHRAHLLGALPYVLLLLCPLIHILGHGRHGSHSDGGGNEAHGTDCSAATRRGDSQPDTPRRGALR